jgi:hypothetical protein
VGAAAPWKKKEKKAGGLNKRNTHLLEKQESVTKENLILYRKKLKNPL